MECVPFRFHVKVSASVYSFKDVQSQSEGQKDTAERKANVLKWPDQRAEWDREGGASCCLGRVRQGSQAGVNAWGA